jgi:hypothetical protein
MLVGPPARLVFSPGVVNLLVFSKYFGALYRKGADNTAEKKAMYFPLTKV